jgi:hypothetical protein
VAQDVPRAKDGNLGYLLDRGSLSSGQDRYFYLPNDVGRFSTPNLDQSHTILCLIQVSMDWLRWDWRWWVRSLYPEM